MERPSAEVHTCNPSYSRGGGLPGQRWQGDPVLKTKHKQDGWGGAHTVEHLPSKCEALSSTPWGEVGMKGWYWLLHRSHPVSLHSRETPRNANPRTQAEGLSEMMNAQTWP
jgi:hypothetical protein